MLEQVSKRHELLHNELSHLINQQKQDEVLLEHIMIKQRDLSQQTNQVLTSSHAEREHLPLLRLFLPTSEIQKPIGRSSKEKPVNDISVPLSSSLQRERSRAPPTAPLQTSLNSVCNNQEKEFTQEKVNSRSSNAFESNMFSSSPFVLPSHQNYLSFQSSSLSTKTGHNGFMDQNTTSNTPTSRIDTPSFHSNLSSDDSEKNSSSKRYSELFASLLKQRSKNREKGTESIGTSERPFRSTDSSTFNLPQTANTKEKESSDFDSTAQTVTPPPSRTPQESPFLAIALSPRSAEKKRKLLETEEVGSTENDRISDIPSFSSKLERKDNSLIMPKNDHVELIETPSEILADEEIEESDEKEEDLTSTKIDEMEEEELLQDEFKQKTESVNPSPLVSTTNSTAPQPSIQTLSPLRARTAKLRLKIDEALRRSASMNVGRSALASRNQQKAGYGV
eukprot:MONOS_5685.1-p1 / transcript=MONOS_5685.1 / gene=MONOS_5685 / organism=Monocercomonoides_exilis_PA203 / gene_product=unspecified product / transcript_product=unspecified product / location=Mono_scaffold00168:88231-89580(+) / protein_length=450 / sequence_SO=supercontig / SO=protein_coding / is_pseudo=false